MSLKCNFADTISFNTSKEYSSTLLCNTMGSVPLKIRYVFDIGSGGTKSKEVLVTPEGKIASTLREESVSMLYQKCISESPDGKSLPKACMDEGLASLMKIISAYGIEDMSSVSIAGIATAWARNAKNINEYMDLLNSYGFNIRIISQQEEGEIAYKSAESHYMPCNGDNRVAVVWDIGGGSYQLSAKEKDGSIYVHQGKYGSANFHKDVRDYIKNKFDVSDTKFWNKSELDLAEEFAQKNVVESIQQDNHLKELMADKCVDVMAIGQLMNLGIKPIIDKSGVISNDKIDRAIEGSYEKALVDAATQYTAIDKKFLPLVQSNFVLIKAIAQGLGQDSFHIIDAKSMDYVATDKSFWPANDFISNPSMTFADDNCVYAVLDSFTLIGSY
jgi:hypothetical protein